MVFCSATGPGLAVWQPVMALVSAAPAKAVPEVLRNSRREVVAADGVVQVEFMGDWRFGFAKREVFIAIGPIIPVCPVPGKTVPGQELGEVHDLWPGLRYRKPLVAWRKEKGL